MRTQSVWNATSSAIFTRKPACTCTAPFGRPVVPLVYATNSGCSLSTAGVAKRALGAERAAARRASTSRPALHRHVVPEPATTTTVWTVGTAATAASAVSFIGTTLPRRVQPSAVTSAGRALLEPHRDRVGAVAGEDRQEDRAELRDREQRGDRLGHHRQEQPDRVALADAARGEAAGDASVSVRSSP